MILSHESCKTQYPHILRQKLQTTSNRKRVAEIPRDFNGIPNDGEKFQKKLLILILNAGTNICFPPNQKKGRIFTTSSDFHKDLPKPDPQMLISCASCLVLRFHQVNFKLQWLVAVLLSCHDSHVAQGLSGEALP